MSLISILGITSYRSKSYLVFDNANEVIIDDNNIDKISESEKNKFIQGQNRKTAKSKNLIRLKNYIFFFN